MQKLHTVSRGYTNESIRTASYVGLTALTVDRSKHRLWRPVPEWTLYIMVLLDEYTRFPVVEILTSVSAKAVIPLIDKVFSLFGIPNVVKTDNGSPFQGQEFKNFSELMGFQHRKITPLWPQGNAECERFMRSIGKAIRAANAEHKNWKQDMYNFLRNYRATKHATTGISPSDLLFGRPMKTKLPSLTPKRKDQRLRHSDKAMKNKMKHYADTKRHSKPSSLKIGDTVLVKQEKRNKSTTPFNPEPFKIIHKKGSMVTAHKNGKDITRNSSFFKKVNERLSDEEADEILETSTDIKFESQLEPRRSARIRKQPKYLKDFVMK